MNPDRNKPIFGALAALVGAACQPIGDDNRQWIEVMPTATKAVNGPWKFTITAEDLEVFAQSIRDQGDRLHIDYDHAGMDGGSTRAAGWFTGDAEVREQRLWAQVQWTPAAADAIRSGEFRFISPEWQMKDMDREGWRTKAKAFIAATLTNRPFFKELAPVGSDGDNGGEPATTEGDAMRDAIVASLGLPKDATDEQITAAIEEQKTKAATADDLQSKVSELEAAAPDGDLEKLAASAKKGEDAAEELRVMKRDTLIAKAIEQRKIDPAEKERYIKLYDEAPSTTAELIESLKAGKLGAIGSESDAPEDGQKPLTATAGSNGDQLSGTHIPATVMIAGTEHDVDEESAKIHVAALALLEEAGKRLTFTADEYTAAAIAAADKQGIRL